MPNIIDANGLQTKTYDELLAELEAGFKAIYGTDINLGQDTPDGQLLNLFIQGYLDLLDLQTQVYNTFDPDNAIGVILDQRVAINGIQRQGGTHTITDITIVTSAACNLYGQDQSVEPVYTIQDNAGTQWQLQTTQTIPGATTTIASFAAVDPGEILTVPNTIQTPVTVVLGVSSVNNPTTYTTLGINEESDADLKIRRSKSVSLASQGYLAGLLAQLENLEGMNSAFVYENNTGSTDSDGVPGNSIWVIVSGTSTDEDIANAIYQKRNAGCGMFGSEVYFVTQVDGSMFQINWDNVLTETLFIVFTATSIDGEELPDIPSIRPGLVTSFVPGVNEEIDVNALATDVQEIDSNTLVSNAGFSNGKLQDLLLDGLAASGVFKMNYNGNATVDINWDDAAGAIETKLQAVAGLSAATVSGSIASQTLNIDLSAVGTIFGLLTISDNTLQTGGAADIAITTQLTTSPTLQPSTKQFQFSVAEENIIITDIQLLPETAIVLASATQQFAGYGGYGSYLYEILVDNSGASIDQNGLYTAGGSLGVDTVQITDALGNTATALVTVT